MDLSKYNLLSLSLKLIKSLMDNNILKLTYTNYLKIISLKEFLPNYQCHRMIYVKTIKYSTNNLILK